MTYWGYHLLLDCSNCNDNIKDKDVIVSFVNELVDRIEMVAYGSPVVEYMLQGDPKQGYSLFQLITTSNISAHFVDLDNSAYIDVFSCKNFDIETVQLVVKKYFDPEKVRINYITRHAD